MSRHDTHDHDAVEQRLRTMLRDRAEDVEPTPALYERVQRDIDRAQRRPLWVGVAVAAAAVAAAVAVVPGILRQQPDIDIAPQPPQEQSDGSPIGGDGEVLLGTAAIVDGEDGSRALVLTDAEGVEVRRLDVTDTGPVDLAVGPGWTTADGVVAYLAERDVLDEAGQPVDTETVVVVLDQADGRAEGATEVVEVGDVVARGLAVTPGGDAVAWVEGAELVVRPLGTGPEATRRLPLEGDLPDEPRLEQWAEVAGEQYLLLSDATGPGLWVQPMDVGSAVQSAPAGAASPVEPVGALGDVVEAVDGGVLADGRLVAVVPATDGTPLRLLVEGSGGAAVGEALGVTTWGREGEPVSLRVTGSSVSLSSNAGTVVYETGGVVEGIEQLVGRQVLSTPFAVPLVDVGVESSSGEVEATAEPTDVITDVGALPLVPIEDGPAVPIDELRTDGWFLSSEFGTLVLVAEDGTTESSVALYGDEPFTETEGTITDVAVRPGSTPDDLTVAVVSEAEGEISIRVARAVDGTRTGTPVVAAVATGPVRSLVWAEDASAVAWADDAGLHAVGLAGDGSVGEITTLSSAAVEGLLDWSWTELDGERLVGTIALEESLPDGTRGTRLAAVASEEAGLVLGEVGPLLPGVRLEAHAGPVLADAPVWRFTESADEVVVELSADGETFTLVARVPVAVRPAGYAVHEGVAVVEAEDGMVRVLADGDVVEIPVRGAHDVVG